MLAPLVSARDFAAEALPPFERPSRYRQRSSLPIEVSPNASDGIGKRGSVGSVSSYKSDGTTTVTVFSNNSSRRSSFTSHGSAAPMPAGAQPSLVKTQWETQRAKQVASAYHFGKPKRSSSVASGAVSLRRRSSQFPRKYFAKLPKEVYERIIEQLELEYFDTEEGGCVSCYLHDMYSLCLVSRPWLVASTRRMFRRIWLPADEHWEAKPQKGNFLFRLKALRKLLRQRPPIARLVRDVRIPGLQELYDCATVAEQEDMLSELASLVMACPSLERFTGITVQYDHDFDRLTHALSTRTNLRECTWAFRRADAIYDEYGNDSFARKALAGWDVDYPDAFLNTHTHWNYISTLILLGGGAGSMDYRSFGATFRLMPFLQSLVISGFDAKEFNDRTLATLPQALSKLRLENLPGISPKGFDKFTKSVTASWLGTLSLINVPVHTVAALQRLFALENLHSLSISQRVAPAVEGESSTPTTDADADADAATTSDTPPPMFESAQLQYLHWDIYTVSTINGYLSDSISRPGSFPKLRKLRCPNDHDGLLQAVCKPTGDLLTAADASIANVFGEIREGKHVGSMTKARHRAQYWINQARREPRLKILVHDETGVVKRRFIVGGFVGRADSNVEFCLEPDVPGQEEPFATCEQWRGQGVVKPPPPPADANNSGGAGSVAGSEYRLASRRSMASNASSSAMSFASPAASIHRSSIRSAWASRPATRDGAMHMLNAASASHFRFAEGNGPPLSLKEVGWCTGPGWGDVLPGQEGKKGHTHPKRRMARLQRASMLF